MSTASLNRSWPTFCAVLLLWPAGAVIAAEAVKDPAALQAEFLRRVNMAQQVSGLFDARATVPDVGGWRSITLLEGGAATQAHVMDADSARSRLRVKVRRQAPFTSDCPVIDELLIKTGEDMWVWDELGWMEINYRRSAAGWRIAGVNYRSDGESP